MHRRLSLVLMLLSLPGVAAAAPPPAPGTANLVIASAKDLVLGAGTSVTTAGCPSGSSSLRSGGQHSKSTVTVATALSPGTTVTSVSFSYEYTTGYKGPMGANFSLAVGGTPVYTSPLLTLFPYTKAGDFSPATPVAAKGLAIKVAPGTGYQLAFSFQGNDQGWIFFVHKYFLRTENPETLNKC